MDNKDTNYRVGVGVTPASEQELVSRIKSKALELAADANHSMPYTRKVTTQSVFTVVDRSLYSNMTFPYSVKEHNALKDVSEFIALAQRNKVINFSILEHTDLLPVAHPQSTQEHDMHPIALEKEQAKWFTSIHGLTNETRGLIASAMTSDLSSPEYLYASTRLESMAEGSIPPEAMFGWRDSIFSGGNSRLARSARARVQNRNSEGRFARMFGAMSAFVRDAATNTYKKLTGRTVGSDQDGNAYIESAPGDISVVPVNKTKDAGKAYIFDKDSKDLVLNFISNKDVSIDSDEVRKVDAPAGWNRVDGYNGPGEKWTDGAYNLVKFDSPSKETSSRIEKELTRAKELDLADPKQIKLGEDAKFYDPDYPLFEISRAKGNTRPFGFAQSWGDVQLLARQDSDLYDRATSNSPEAKRAPRTSQDIDDYQYPEGYYRLNKDVKFTPTGPEDGKSDSYTDDPIALANLFDEEELGNLLRKAVTPEDGSEIATGVTGVSFDTENPDLVDDLPAEAIYSALDRATGGEAKYEIAKIYDEGNDNTANIDALEATEAITPKGDTKTVEEEKKKKAQEKADKVKTEETEEVVQESYTPPLLRGLTDDELAEFKETRDYSKYLPKNSEFEIPDGYSSLDPDPVSEAEINRITDASQSDVLPVGWDDSPLNISKNYSSKDLKTQLEAAISPDNENAGQGLISLPTDDGEMFTGAVSAEKIRDALQLQGEDTNSILDKSYKSGMEVSESESKVKPKPSDDSGADDSTEVGKGDGGKPPVEEAPIPSDQPDGPRLASVAALDLKKGDVAYESRNYETDELDENGKPILGQFLSVFTLDEDPDPANTITVESSRGPITKISVKGHFPDGPTQEKFWGENTLITTIRDLSEEELPKLGDLPPLNQPAPKNEKYGEQGQKHPDFMPDRIKYFKEMATRNGAWTPPESLDLDTKPEKVVSARPKGSVSKPDRPREPRKSPFLSAFTDKAREISKIKATNAEGRKARWGEFKKFFDSKEIVYLDTETTGFSADKDGIFQISLTKAKGRTKGETLTIWINPEKPLDPRVVEELNQKDRDGNPLTDEWLQKNGISYEEAGRQVSDFIGTDATIGAYNTPFDAPFLRKLYEAAGVDYDSNIIEEFDVLAFADKVQQRDKDQAYRPEEWNAKFNKMYRPRALKLKEQAEHWGHTLTNAHDAVADVDATIEVANSILDRAVDTGQNATLFEIDKQQESYNRELDDFNANMDQYRSDIDAYNAAREADKKDPIAPEVTDKDGEATSTTGEIVPNTVTPESNNDRPVGPLSDMDPEWINDDKNTASVDSAVEDLQPGDYVTINGRQQRVDAIRIGASYGVEDGVARVTFTDVETGRQTTGNLPRNRAFTGVRRPIDPKSVQEDKNATKDDSDAPLSPTSEFLDNENRPVTAKNRETVKQRKTFTLGDGSGVVEIYPNVNKEREEDPDFYTRGIIYDAEGNIISQIDGFYFTYEGASNEMERRVRQDFIDLTKADRADQMEFDFDNASDDVEISKGDEAGYDIDHEEVFNTQYGYGKVTVRKLVDQTGRVWYVVDASGFDNEGEFIDETQEVFSSKEEAISYGRRWLANSNNVKKNQIDAEQTNQTTVNEEDSQTPDLIPDAETQPAVDIDGTEVPSKVPYWEEKRRKRGKHRKPAPSLSVSREESRAEFDRQRRPLARPDSSIPKGSYLISEPAESLKPGDVLFPDGFTILKVEQAGNNIVFTGFYPGRSMQNLVEYNAANKNFRVIRGLNNKEAPKEGDLRPIVRPNPIDYPGGRQSPLYQRDRKNYLNALLSTRKTWSPPKDLDEYAYTIKMSLLNEFTYGFQVYYGRYNSQKQAKLLKKYEKLIKVSADRLSERGLPTDFDVPIPDLPSDLSRPSSPRLIDLDGVPTYYPPSKKSSTYPEFSDEDKTAVPNLIKEIEDAVENEGTPAFIVQMIINDQEAFNVFAKDYWEINMVLPNGNPIGPMPASFPEELRIQLDRPEFTDRPQEGAVLRLRDGISTWVNPDGSTAPFNPEDPTQGTSETNGKIYGSNDFAGPEKSNESEVVAPEDTTAPAPPEVARPASQPASDSQEPVVVEPTPAPEVPKTNEVPVTTESEKKKFEERRRVINETWTREQNNHISRSADGVESLEIGDLVYHYRLLTDEFNVYGVVTRTGLDAYGNLNMSTTGEMLDYRDTRFPGYVEITYFGQDGKPLTRETVGRKGENKGQVVSAVGIFKRASRNFFVVQKYDGRVPENSPLATGESINDLEQAPASPRANREGFRAPRTTSRSNQTSSPKTVEPTNTPEIKSDGTSWGVPLNVNPDLSPGTSTWEDVRMPTSKQTDIPNNRVFESAVANAAIGSYDQSVLESERLSGVDQISRYVTEILKKYGYGERSFKTLARGKMLSSAGAHAGVGRTTDPFTGETPPALFIFARKKYNKSVIIHEIAHLLQGSWLDVNDKDRGHSPEWYDTYVTILRGEGLNDAADILEEKTGRKAQTTGVLNKVDIATKPEPKTSFTPEEVSDLQSPTNKKSYSVQEAMDMSGSNSSVLNRVNSLLNGTEEDPYALFESVDLGKKLAVVSDEGVPVKSLFTDMPLFNKNPNVEKIKYDYLHGNSIDPILVVQRDGKLYVANGLDQVQASYELGIENIRAIIVSSDKNTPASTDGNFYSFGEISGARSIDYVMLAIQSDKSEAARDKVVSSILDALEAGVLPWNKPWSSSGILPTNGNTGKTYSGLNTLVLWASGAMGEKGDRARVENVVGVPFSTNIWIGFNQAKAMGGSVKKGSKGTSILRPVMKDVEVVDPKTGEKKMEKRRVGYADTSVFNLDQIDGLDELRTASDREPVPVTEAEKALFDAYKDAPPIKNSPQDSAYYSTVEDAIYLPNREQFASEEGYFETLAHEMIHSTGHSSRLDRTDLTDKYGTHRASRAEEELIAEIGTAILASMLGVDLDINQPASYIASWLESLKDDKGMILKAAIASQKAADYILKGANLGSYGKSGEEIARDRVS